MRFPFVANLDNGQNNAKRDPRLASPWIVLAFVGMILVVLIIIFPKRNLLQAILDQNSLAQKKSSNLTLSYLRNLIKVYPHHPTLRLLLAKQAFKVGNIQEAQTAIKPLLKKKPQTQTDWLALWLYYQTLYAQTYSYQPQDPRRQHGEANLKRWLVKLRQAQLTAFQYTTLAQEALALEQPGLALHYYQLAYTKDPQQPTAFFVQAAKVALQTQAYQQSAAFYFAAQQRATTLAQQRQFFMAALKSLQAGDQVTTAIVAAQKNITPALAHDYQTLIYLTHLALAADKPNLASQYVKKALQVQQRGQP